MYKRPIPRAHAVCVQEFVSTALPRGATRSYWAPTAHAQVIPSGHPSRVGEILDKMRNMRVAQPPPPQWTPPCDYEFIAAKMDNPGQFLERCKQWFANNPPRRAPRALPPGASINQEPIIEAFAKYAKVEDGPKPPPLAELEKAWRAAGYTEERIAKALAWHAKMEATADERQKALDLIFAKFPSANKPTPKLKAKKVIKVVKKKLPGVSNE